MENEIIWLKIPDFPKYSVSNTGQVRNDRTNRILKQALDSDGYPLVTPFQELKQCTRTVHKLVASAFLPKPSSDMVLDHIDRNRLNNAVSNLRWVSQQHNMFNRSKQVRPATSIHLGVSFEKARNKWVGRIMLNGKHKLVGRFNTEEEAGAAVAVARKSIHIVS